MSNDTPEVEPLIRLHFFTANTILTVDEFDQLERDVLARIYVGEKGMAESILARLIEDNRYRANECRNDKLMREKIAALADHLLVIPKDICSDDIIWEDQTHVFRVYEATWRVIGRQAPFTFELKDTAR